MAAPPIKLKKGQKKLMDTLKRSQARNTDARARSKMSTKNDGTLKSRVNSAKNPPKTSPKADLSTKDSYKYTQKAEPKPKVTVSEKPTKPGPKFTTKIKEGYEPYKGSPKPKAPSGSAAGKAASSGSGSVARSALRWGARVAGPAGALVGMTEEANKGEKEWIEDKANRGPLMSGNGPNKFSKSGPIQAARDMRKGAPVQIKAVKGEIDDRAKPAQKRDSRIADGRSDTGARVKYGSPVGPNKPVPKPTARPSDLKTNGPAVSSKDKMKSGMQGRAGKNVFTGEKAGQISKANPVSNQGKKPDKTPKYPAQRTFADSVRGADAGDSFLQRKMGNRLRSLK